jgi:interleukin-1 receptor-associated kinase 1
MASLLSHTGTRRRFALLASATLAVLILCYPTFDAASEADFSFSPGSGIANGSLQITPITGDISHRSGRVCYAREKLKLWNSERTALTSFRTEFVLNILPRNGTGEGMAFILTNNPELPANSSGQWLGVTNGRTDGSPANRIVAVEFDTRKSGVDDLDGNHVGLDVNSVRSVSTYPLTNLSIVLASGSDVSVSIQYDGAVLSVVAVQTYTFMYSWAGDLSRYLTENITVGFAASTGEFTELNQIKSWNFTTLGDDAGGRRGRRQARKRLILLLAYLIPLAVAGSFLALCLWRRLTRPGRLAYRNLEKMIDARGPVRFGFRELRNATANFSSDRKLGRGGFGTVYLGYLSTGMEVAVKLKRVMASVGRSSRGEQEFVAEVNSISKLSHRNLVKLVGWCHERGELMLVYEYFPMGSLDKLLYADAGASGVAAASAPELTWERRYGVICGVAAALEYLHHGSSRRILHRDVKASNVMLDGGYGARLGDFGLARVVRSDGDTHHSTRAVAGTRGYMAPESFFTGRASLATDAYAFGVFVLEVVSGRRPSSPVPQHHSYLDDDDDLGGGDHDDAVDVAGGARRWREDAYVVDWAWRLYGEGRAWRAADAALGGAFDPEGVERAMRLALACCHPDPRERPSMREAVQVLAGGVEAPEPPLVKPAFVWPPDGGRRQEMEMARVGVLFTGTGAHSSFCSMTSSSIITGR